MSVLFYGAAAVAVVATVLAITRAHAIHALLHFAVSLLAVALVFFTLGAPFIAALEVIIYAGAIIVLLVFVVMLLNVGRAGAVRERRLLSIQSWWGPGALCLVLALELAYLFGRGEVARIVTLAVEPRVVGISLFGPYLLALELASMLLLVGLVAAYHLGRPGERPLGDAARVVPPGEGTRS